MKRVKLPADIPNGKHYAVIEFRKVTESSGWGPENDSQVLCPHIYVSEDVDDWTAHVKALEAEQKRAFSGCDYVALQVQGKAKIETTVNLVL